MNFRKAALWLAMLAVLLVEVDVVGRLARRRANAGARAFYKTQSVPGMDSPKQAPQTVLRAEEREREKQIHSLKKARKTVRQLMDEKETLKGNLAYYEILYYPKEPSLEEFRETQPKEYEKLKREVAGVLRYATARKSLREEYLSQLDFSVLTNEERQMLLSTVEQVTELEDCLLDGGEGEGLYYKAGKRSFGELRQWMREGGDAYLAAMADWKSTGGTKQIVTVMRALFLHRSHPWQVQPNKPQTMRGTNSVLISDPEAPNGTRVVSVNVEPGWTPE